MKGLCIRYQESISKAICHFDCRDNPRPGVCSTDPYLSIKFKSSLLHFILHILAWPRGRIRRQWATAYTLARGILRTWSVFSWKMKTDSVNTCPFWPKDLHCWEMVCPELHQEFISRPTPDNSSEGDPHHFPHPSSFWRYNHHYFHDLEGQEPLFLWPSS